MKEPNEPNDSPAEEGAESPNEDRQEQQSYTPPPTKRDAAMSTAHHVDSLEYNLRHADAHLQEAKRHAGRLAARLPPDSRGHLRRVSR